MAAKLDAEAGTDTSIVKSSLASNTEFRIGGPTAISSVGVQVVRLALVLFSDQQIQLCPYNVSDMQQHHIRTAVP